MSDEESNIFKLLNYAITDGNAFLPDEKIATELEQVCIELWSRDNVCTIVSNPKGMLCSTYPGKLIIPIKQRIDGKSDFYIDQSSVANKEFQELVIKGRFARTRGRFPMPVLLIGDKFVCRSSTLARSPEIYTRTGYQYFMQGEGSSQAKNENGKEDSAAAVNIGVVNLTNLTNGCNSSHERIAGIDLNCVTSNHQNGKISSKKHKLMQSAVQTVNGTNQNKEWLLDKMRKSDIDILNALKVNVICDLMVENKKVKYGLNVTSSEKVDRQNRYGDFHLISIPYPGCEFFADYSRNNYTGAGLKFDWKQAFVDAELQIPSTLAKLHEVNWNDYMQWDLITLTQNYLKLLLRCLILPSSTGILLHCISGWDRTPLFISLLRLSLWADGLIHQSLNAEEIVYLTLAYDWFLFNHQFSDRIYKNEEIMRFCFEFLNDMTSEEYSLLPKLYRNQNVSSELSEIDNMFQIGNTTGNQNNEHILTTANGFSVKEDAFESLDCTCGQFMSSFANHSDKPLLSLKDVNSCLLCATNNKSQIEDFDRQTLIQDSTCYPLISSSSSSVAVLPLNTSDNVLSDRAVPVEAYTKFLNGSDSISDQNISPPLSALSSSYETAKDEIFSFSHENVSAEPMKKAMSSSLGFTEILSKNSCHVKSDPIPVPFKRVKESSIRVGSMCSSVCSSNSNAHLAHECGSSWQLISTSPLDMSSAADTNSSVSSNCQLSHNNSFTFHGANGICDQTGFKLKMEKRKEKLKSAHEIMIPIYSAVVGKQKQLQEQSGFSTLVDTLVHLVKRA